MGQGHSPFLSFGNDEEIVRRVCSKCPEIESEWGDVPPLDWLGTHDRWDSKETETLVFRVAESDEAPAESRGEVSLKG